MVALIAALVFGPYSDIRMEGWTARVEKQLLAKKELWEPVRRELGNQLYRISRVVDDKRLADLRKIVIWVHEKSPWTACMAYHPDAGWLRDNKLNPAMANGIEIGNAKAFLSWTYEQPWMVLHELAHGYHHRFLEKQFDNDLILSRFRAAVDSKKYENVLHWNGKTVKHYAITNQMEFFAEATEAYFGQNDFYPFVRSELLTWDPDTFKLLEQIWGSPQKRG